MDSFIFSESPRVSYYFWGISKELVFFHLDICLVQTQDLKQKVERSTRDSDGYPLSISTQNLLCCPIDGNENKTDDESFHENVHYVKNGFFINRTRNSVENEHSRRSSKHGGAVSWNGDPEHSLPERVLEDSGGKERHDD